MPKALPPIGTKKEVDTFHEVNSHYKLATEDLDTRIYRKNGFNDIDRLVASHIDPKNWPYKSMIFEPIPYTVLLEKSARLIGSKPKGRLVPREGGDTLGAYINNEVLSYQWDDNERLGESMISKWVKMDQGTRKYGKKFALCLWRYETRVVDGKRKVFYDGPDFKIVDSRNCLPNPSYSTVQKWFQVREYLTLSELENVNDVARKEPVYKNLDLLRDSLKERGKSAGRGDRQEATSVSTNKEIRGLSDFLGRDETFKVIEVVTEYRKDRWITFVPKHGIVIRDIPNPYKHGEIPVVELCYYPLEDDLYGQNEFESSTKLLRAINALFSGFTDEMAISIAPPLMINPINVRMHTLDMAPEAKWLMNKPGEDVVRFEGSSVAGANFQNIYYIMKAAVLSAVGENSQGISTANPTQDQGKVTATEIKDSAFTRNVRDNMNQIFLSEALKKQVMFWHSMNQQFMFTGSEDKAKIIRIVGRDAVEYFKRQGLSDIRPTEEDVMQVSQGLIPQEQVPPGPRFAVDLDGVEVPKFQPDDGGEGGNLIVEPGDLVGNYDYIPDIETMKAPSDQDIEAKMTSILATITNPAILQGLAQENSKPKFKEILVKMYEATKVIKDAEAYFEDLPPAQPQLPVDGQPNPTGGPGAVPSPQGAGSGPIAGLPGGLPPVAPGQDQTLLG